LNASKSNPIFFTNPASGARPDLSWGIACRIQRTATPWRGSSASHQNIVFAHGVHRLYAFAGSRKGGPGRAAARIRTESRPVFAGSAVSGPLFQSLCVSDTERHDRGHQ